MAGAFEFKNWWYLVLSRSLERSSFSGRSGCSPSWWSRSILTDYGERTCPWKFGEVEIWRGGKGSRSWGNFGTNPQAGPVGRRGLGEIGGIARSVKFLERPAGRSIWAEKSKGMPRARCPARPWERWRVVVAGDSRREATAEDRGRCKWGEEGEDGRRLGKGAEAAEILLLCLSPEGWAVSGE
jgi:hypothetical protein